MKFLKGLLIAILTLVAIYFILALFGPSDYKVERSKEINAPVDVVYNQFSNFENWEAWSPWQEKDSSVKNTYEGEMGQVNSKMSWIGDEELSGTGSMTITAIEPNKSINYDLAFVVPFEMSSKGGISLEEKDGKTIVTWYDQGDIPFMMRPMMLFMDLDAQIGPDFEKGLANIDAITQEIAKAQEAKPIEIVETTVAAKNYVGIRHNTTFEAVMDAQFYEENFKKLGMYMGQKQLKMVEGTAPSVFYYEWNEKDSTCIAVPAFALEGLTKVEQEGFELIEVKESKAILAKFYGPYEESYKAHIKLEEYLKEKGLEMSFCLEEYMNDPASVSNPSEILTHITYFLK